MRVVQILEDERMMSKFEGTFVCRSLGSTTNHSADGVSDMGMVPEL